MGFGPSHAAARRFPRPALLVTAPALPAIPPALPVIPPSPAGYPAQPWPDGLVRK